MSRLVTILTAQQALLLSCVLALVPATIARSQPAPASAPVAPASPTAIAAPVAPKSPTTLANQPVVTPREGGTPATPKSPASPAGPDDQKLINLARQLSASSPPTPASPSQVTPAASLATTGSKPLPAKRDSSAPITAEAATESPADNRPLSARRRGDLNEPGTESTLSSGSGGWATTIGALTGVVGLIFVLRAGLSRWTGGVSAASRSAVVQVISRVAVAPRNHVLLLRVGGRVLVVGDSPTGMRTLAQIDDAEEIADILAAASSSKPTSISSGFRQLLSGFTGEYTQQERAAVGSDEQEMRVDRARDKVGGLVGKIRSIAGKGGEA